MTLPKLTKLELQIMDALWTRGVSSIREIQEAFPERLRPAYTTVQTTVYRMERKQVLRHHSFHRGQAQLIERRRRAHRSKSSSCTREPVFSSRYFTITAHCSDSPHFAAAGIASAREPGTTTAPAGITSN
jgi:predicted transcriptional regulator